AAAVRCAPDADNACAWPAVEMCPGTDCGEGGFCYQATGGDDCTCVCPLEPCMEGEDCPTCGCACVDAGGADTCTCSTTVCPDDDPSCMPVVDCQCYDDDDGCGTCTWCGTGC